MGSLPDRSALEAQIRRAFSGVTLGKGISLRQAQAVDSCCEGVSREEFEALPKGEITDDWSQVPLSELDRDCVAHLDEEGFRYYLPAFLLSILSDYDPGSMRVIGTIHALHAKPLHPEHHERRYRILDDTQRAAVACFLHALPRLVNLDAEDLKRVTRSVRNYWQRYLPIEIHGT